jgi:hypothetical protein
MSVCICIRKHMHYRFGHGSNINSKTKPGCGGEAARFGKTARLPGRLWPNVGLKPSSCAAASTRLCGVRRPRSIMVEGGNTSHDPRHSRAHNLVHYLVGILGGQLSAIGRRSKSRLPRELGMGTGGSLAAHLCLHSFAEGCPGQTNMQFEAT